MKYIISIIVLSLAICSCTDYGQKINYGKNELFYTKNVTKSDAEKLGNYLESQRFFLNDGKTVSVQLDKFKDTFRFRMVVLDSFINDKNFEENAKAFPTDLSKNVFENKPVLAHFCDNRFNLVKIIRPEN